MTQERNNDADDAAVLAAIQAGENKCALIMTALDLPSRVVDRALQRLRRRGLIVYKGGNWSAK
jgi:DNA-binding IclR family transcriptional regulator